MVIALDPELETKIAAEAEMLGYPNAEAYVLKQLTEWQSTEAYLLEDGKTLDEMIQEGLDEADRGEFFSPEEVKQRLAAMKLQWLAGRVAA